VFLQVFQMHISSVSYAFRRMLQVLYLDVSKLDRVLHLCSQFLLPCLGVFSSRCWLVIRRPFPLLDAGDVQGGVCNTSSVKLAFCTCNA
jgi:hypothetical protein